jgi:hypothetical protein
MDATDERLRQILTSTNKVDGAALSGSPTAGSVAAQLNAILGLGGPAALSDLNKIDRAAYAGSPVAGSLGAVLNTVNSNVGATGDTGGTSSAGSVMAKLNRIIGGSAPSWYTAPSGYQSPWDDAASSHQTSGTFGNVTGQEADAAVYTTSGSLHAKLNAILTGPTSSMAAGTIGGVLQSNLDAKLSSRLAASALPQVGPSGTNTQAGPWSIGTGGGTIATTTVTSPFGSGDERPWRMLVDVKYDVTSTGTGGTANLSVTDASNQPHTGQPGNVIASMDTNAATNKRSNAVAVTVRGDATITLAYGGGSSGATFANVTFGWSME